jgi:hypothetical protein
MVIFGREMKPILGKPTDISDQKAYFVEGNKIHETEVMEKFSEKAHFHRYFQKLLQKS